MNIHMRIQINDVIKGDSSTLSADVLLWWASGLEEKRFRAKRGHYLMQNNHTLTTAIALNSEKKWQDGRRKHFHCWSHGPLHERLSSTPPPPSLSFSEHILRAGSHGAEIPPLYFLLNSGIEGAQNKLQKQQMTQEAVHFNTGNARRRALNSLWFVIRMTIQFQLILTQTQKFYTSGPNPNHSLPSHHKLILTR